MKDVSIFKHLLEIYTYPIVISSMDGTLLFANDVFAKNNGFKNGKAVIGLNFFEINKTEYDNKTLIDILEREGKIDNYEVNGKDLNGKDWCILFSSRVIRFNSQNAILSTTIDITKQKKLELELIKHQQKLKNTVKERTEELETTNKKLQATNEELYRKGEIINSKNEELKKTLKHLKETQIKLFQAEKMASLGTLTAGVSHEINNPLNFIMGSYAGFESYFKEYGSQNEELTTKLLNAMKLGIERTTCIVKGLNQFSRDNGNYDEECNIPTIIDNCLVMLQNKLKNKVEIFKNYHSEIIIIKGNVGKLHQVFLNLLTNAIDAISDTGKITIETGILNQEIVISVSDNGIGIDKDYLSQIADPFFTTKPPGKAIGLGLSITYSIIKEHNGTINFESEKNKGTKVTIYLPTKLK